MTNVDRALAVLAILLLAAYLAILIWRVPEPGLAVVCLVTVCLAAYDFIRTAFLDKS